jgi:hypothetical protein
MPNGAWLLLGLGVRLCWARCSWSSSFRPIGVVGPFASPTQLERAQRHDSFGSPGGLACSRDSAICTRR